MKKLALAIAMSAAAVSAQAANTSIYHGTLDGLATASANAGTPYTAAPPGASSSVTYEITLITDAALNGALLAGSTITLNGSFSTVGAVGIPVFATQTFDFNNAVYDISTSNSTNSSVIDYGTYVGTDELRTNGGAPALGDALAAGAPAAGNILSSGSATCTNGPAGAGGAIPNTSCATFNPNDMSALSSDFSFLFGVFTPYDITTSISFVSTTGGTGYLLSGEGTAGPAAAVPVPAAAWLFGSALVGLAGIGRKRKA